MYAGCLWPRSEKKQALILENYLWRKRQWQPAIETVTHGGRERSGGAGESDNSGGLCEHGVWWRWEPPAVAGL